jgi:hypothetical protein
MANPIANQFQTSQLTKVQAIPYKNQFGLGVWSYSIKNNYDWQPGVAQLSDQNYSTKGEGWQKIKNGMYNRLTGDEPIYGLVNYELNPLNNEQCNAHKIAYQQQKNSQLHPSSGYSKYLPNPNIEYPSTRFYNSFTNSSRT